MNHTMYKNETLMSRIRTVNEVRSFASSPLAGACLAMLFLIITSVMISVGDVVHNVMVQSEWGSRFSYIYSSILHSEIIVQALAALTFISCLMVLYRSLRRLKTPLYFVGNFIVSYSPVRFFRS